MSNAERRTEKRVQGNEYCTIEIELRHKSAGTVLAICGEYGTIRADGTEALVSCGPIREELSRFFPEAQPHFKWHLNDMNAGCVHQREAKWAEQPIDPDKPLNAYGRHCEGQTGPTYNMLIWVRPEEHPEGLLGAPCPHCGYEYGTKWLFEELPEETVKWARGE